MKKRILFTVLLFINSLLISFGQSKYEQGMSKALQMWGNKNNTEAIALFERIASAEKNEWLPDYYAGLIYTMDVLANPKQENASSMLKQAKMNFDKAESKSANNPEIICLQGLMNTAWVVLDPMTNGPKLSGSIIEGYQKAMQLDPENPRPIYLLADYQINMAKFFEQDTQAFYEMLKVSLKKFDTFKAPTAFYPNWGEQQAKQILKTQNEHE